MARSRRGTLASLFTGLIAAILVTLAGMLAIALISIYLRIGDRLLSVLNQLIKLAAILSGVRLAVPRGGERGFATGVLLALVYTVAGYALYLLLGGGSFSAGSMLGEMLLGAAAGAVCGAVRANQGPKRRKSAGA